MDARIRRELRFLEGYAVLSTLVFGTLLLTAFRQNQEKQRFTEIDVERINIVEPDGKLRMVIANRPRSIGPIYKGKPFGYAGGSRPGIIFFNDEGTENGGLTFNGRRLPNGQISSNLGMSFDQFDQDQVVVLNYSDNNGRRNMGFTINDRADANIFDLVAERDSIMKMPEGQARDEALRRWQGPRNGVPLNAQRVYLGRATNKSAVLNLSDPMGRPRLRLMVDSLGAAAVEFLDDQGRVTARLPATQ
ncbi:MAG: hypothetical protein ACRENP_13430 [Longimicrobiales bacterium]